MFRALGFVWVVRGGGAARVHGVYRDIIRIRGKVENRMDKKWAMRWSWGYVAVF